MKKILMMVPILLLTGSLAFAGDNREESVERMNNASAVLHEVMNAPDKGIPQEVVDDAKCIVVVPHLVKGGFIFGGKYGRGVATCRTSSGWSAPAFVAVGGGSWGLQIGAEAVDLVMVIMNDKGLQHLLSSKFELTGEGSVAAGPVGRHASAGTDWTLNTEALTYSRTKGVFAGLTLEGAVVQKDDDATKAIYGRNLEVRPVLTGQVPAPATASTFMTTVREVSREARQAEASHGDTK